MSTMDIQWPHLTKVINISTIGDENSCWIITTFMAGSKQWCVSTVILHELRQYNKNEQVYMKI